ncbi:MAG: ATP-binding protein [Spirochaetaceae bacterium]|jgi:MinD superfamily P-loop ATPase|nr:ATP-binding protein [Spirochaetaceae bacterium]
MKIAVLSGKGGTGKTTISNNLAALLPQATLIDCDVEEPNSHIFMNPILKEEEDVKVGYPVIDEEKCTHCRKCATFCHYNAIIASTRITMPMKELCHDCGGCALVCEADAIKYEYRNIGKIYEGTSRFSTKIIYGALNTGELSGVKIINRIYEIIKGKPLVIVDSPPGTSCSTVAAVEDCDYALIVTEPTPFGASDMKMVVEMLKEMKIPFSLVINKAGLGDNEVYEYCKKENLEIIGEQPFDMAVAEAYAVGKLAIEVNTGFRNSYEVLWERIFSKVVALHGSK